MSDQFSRPAAPRSSWVECPPTLQNVRLLVPEADLPAVHSTLRQLEHDDDPSKTAATFAARLAEHVSPVTLADLWRQLSPLLDEGPAPSRGSRAESVRRTRTAASTRASWLAAAAGEGRARVLLTFAGQGQSYLDELAALFYGDAAARTLIEHLARELDAELADGAQLAGYHPQGLPLSRWFDEPTTRPSAARLASAPHSMPLVFLTQAARLASLRASGFESEQIAEWAVAAAGHSQGVVAAYLAALGLPLDALVERAGRLARLMLWQGIRMQQAWGRSPEGPSTMLVVNGWEADELDRLLAGDEGTVRSLRNGPRRHVFSGPHDLLRRFVARLEQERRSIAERFAAGVADPPRPFELEWLSVSAPFHSPAMRPALGPLAEDAQRLGIRFDPEELAIPLLRGEDGESWRGEPSLLASQCVERVDWATTIDAARRYAISHVLDLGPGGGVAALSAERLRGYGVEVIAAATPSGGELLEAAVSRADDQHEPAAITSAERGGLASRSVASQSGRGRSGLRAGKPWSDYAPQLVRVGGGAPRLENRFTQLTAHPPIIVPGMTPTTTEAAIVAAAANAGYLAELAGGGQPTEAILRRRVAELRAALAPGNGYLFNALYLDRYLWDLHLGPQRLVQRLIAAGEPIRGVTISAGTPAPSEAVPLLRELSSLGAGWSSLKVGTDEQIESALATADDLEGLPLIVQIEGGAAGGHHSLEPLDELLLRWYPRLRRRTNVFVAVGGGIATGERVAELLHGDWSRPYDEAPMPVDAVFAGTALMAAKEAATSSAVKRALAHARGGRGPLAHGARSGDVVSGRSSLGAEIHYLDNHASRTALWLETLAGDREAVSAQREAIISALEKSAKPYLGDLRSMSYRGLLERLVALMALGDGSPYCDGYWLDRSHRLLVWRLLDRALRRCGFDGSIPAPEELDDPQALLARVTEACPRLASAPVFPEDERYLLDDLCRRPGKPLPFVPRIDENIHRAFTSDALWQSHCDRFEADAVLVIPGPSGLGAIARPDQPLAEILAGLIERSAERCVAAVSGRAVDARAIATRAEHCLFRRGERPNPLSRGIDPQSLRETEEGVRLVHRHRCPDGEAQPLELDFDVRAGHARPLRCAPGNLGAIAAFYRAIGRRAKSVPPDLASFRRCLDDDGDAVPLAWCFAQSFAAIFERALELAGDANPLSLLHLESAIEWLDEAPQQQAAWSCTIDRAQRRPTPTGLEIEIGARLIDDGRAIAALTQRFLLRDFEPTGAEALVASGIDASAGGAGASASESDGVLEAGSYPRLAEPQRLFEQTLDVPVQSHAYALASGDWNPIHHDPLLARFAGLDEPIAHGQWVSGRVCALLVERGSHLRRSVTRYLAPVSLGQPLVVRAQRLGWRDGDELIECYVSQGARRVAHLLVQRTPPRCAYLFPGQGTQRQGMGMEAYERSEPARGIWDRADRHTRSRYGFSLLHVVRDNPRELAIGSELVRHPEGVLHLTQLTQVALTVLAAASVAELRESGRLSPRAMFAGHSVGEYAAISALTELLPLEALVDTVYQRGLTMQRFVPRDADGRSRFRMGVIKPHAAGISGLEAERLVEEVAARSGKPLYVVNYNVRDRQYAVAGDLEAIAELVERLPNAASREGAAWVLIPGIDVPFHSPLLRSGVGAFRQVLEAAIPRDVDVAALEGRYVPNLVAQPFELTRDFVAAIVRATATDKLAAALDDPCAHGRAILIECLAWQFASPVRWIETQELLVRRVSTLLEIGPAHAPVLGNMLRASRLAELDEVRILHLERDRAALEGGTPSDAPSTVSVPPKAAGHGPSVAPNPEAPSSAAAAVTVAQETSASLPHSPHPSASPSRSSQAPSAGSGQPGVEIDTPLALAEALVALVALQLDRDVSEVDRGRSLDALLGGNSARRNQVLLDIGNEFGIGAVDGAHELPLERVAEQIASARGKAYRHPGPYLSAAQEAALATLDRTREGTRRELVARYLVGDRAADALVTLLAVGVRAAGSNARSFEEQLERALALYAQLAGARPASRAATPAAQADLPAAAAQELLAGQRQHWLSLARQALIAADLDPLVLDAPAPASRPSGERIAGSRPDQRRSGRFDAERHVAFRGSEIWARADARRLLLESSAARPDRVGESEREARWQALVSCASAELVAQLERACAAARARRQSALVERLEHWLATARLELECEPLLAGKTALVTGAGPGSIAEALVRWLLRRGARVVVGCSRLTRPRRAAFRQIYRESACRGAELHLAPFDQGSSDDVEALVRWLIEPAYREDGAAKERLKGPWAVDFCFPFGAAAAEGDLSELTAELERTLAVNLFGVQRLVAALARWGLDRFPSGPRTHVILPLSPNHGQMGRDGLYAEAKVALEAMLARWSSEHDAWGRGVSLIGARIGWVRGTGLMAGLDRVASLAQERLGIRTFAPDEMADELGRLCLDEARVRASVGPFVADLSGGLDESTNLRPIIAEALQCSRTDQIARDGQIQLSSADRGEHAEAAQREALPSELFAFPVLPEPTDVFLKGTPSLDLSRVVVIVGRAEVGPFGNERVRWAIERDGRLSPEAALELAWLCGCVRFEAGRWVDASSGEPIEAHELESRYRLSERVGIRLHEPAVDDEVTFPEVRLEQDLAFRVATRAEAERYLAQDAEKTSIVELDDGAWRVVKRAGARIRVPRLEVSSRDVSGRLPDGWSAERMGLGEEARASIDPLALYNLVATAEAFRSAGLTPEQLWSIVHPARIANSQGSGIGGMASLKGLYVDPALDRSTRPDVLQDTLINVTSAYSVMAYSGSYGPMIHPVAACATAAVSIEVGSDLIRSGKADFAVAGGFDDLGPQGMRGFASMQATISAEARRRRGLEPDESSRPGDTRRAGFVESQGGGTVLLCRADLALAHGLPIYGVVAGAWSCSDGLQRSVPAPGPGLLSLARGGTSSVLARALSAFGLDAGAIGVVSWHGTSTTANDVNEASLYRQILGAIGRQTSDPVPVIAQKALTGHSKGGAGAWQLVGLTQVMEEGIVPALRNLDDPDPRVTAEAGLLFSDRPLALGRGAIRAALLTSLGFGHVSSMLCLVHPDCLLERLSLGELSAYRSRRHERWRWRFRSQHAVLLGDEPLFSRPAAGPVTPDREQSWLLGLGADIAPGANASRAAEVS